jgi:hypothetical protein
MVVVQGAHLEALAIGTQLTSLVLTVYQAGHSRCPLDPLMALTNLQHLEVGYGGAYPVVMLLVACPVQIATMVFC